MGDKAMTGLSGPRRSRQTSRAQKVARTSRQLTEVRNKNLAKARRVRKKNLLEKKRAAKK